MSTLQVPPIFATDEVLIRSAVVEEVDADKGIVDARLARYEHEAEIDEGLSEIFTRAAFSAACGNPSRCKVTDQQHNRAVVIGSAVELRDEADALYGRLRISDTAAGRDVLTLLRDGALEELSLEFRPQRRFMKVSRRDSGLLVRHDKATLVGISPVSAGAYGDASRVLAVRTAARNRAQEKAIAELNALRAGSSAR